MLRRTVSYVALAISAFSASATSAQTDWTGAYVGLFVGGAVPSFDNDWNSGIFCGVGSDPSCAEPVNDLETVGLMSGIRLGYDRQINDRYVVGISADVAETRIANSTYYRAFDGIADSSERAELQVNAMGSVRGRLGLDLDDFLVYGSVGATLVSADFAASTSNTTPRQAILGINAIAPSLGIGAEWLVQDSITIGAALNHVFLDNNYELGGFGDGNTTDSEINFNSVTSLELSLNYRF